MTTKLGSLSLFMVTLLAVFISMTGIGTKTSLPGQIFQIMFIPITAYLTYALVNHWSGRKTGMSSQNFWERPVIYYCFVVVITMIIISFLSAHTPAQIVSSIIFTPVGLFFLWSVWPRGDQNSFPIKVYTTPDIHAVPSPPPVLDENRREFIKAIGTAGISILLYNFLFKRDTPALFSSPTNSTPTPLSLKNAQGDTINPAERSPTQGYYITQIDDSPISYFGFVNQQSNWFIMRQDADNSYRYSKGDKDFPSNWANRTNLQYDFFNNVF